MGFFEPPRLDVVGGTERLFDPGQAEHVAHVLRDEAEVVPDVTDLIEVVASSDSSHSRNALDAFPWGFFPTYFPQVAADTSRNIMVSEG